MEGRPAPEGGEHTALEEHFVWLSKDYTPYDNNPGSPFIPPDFTLGLPPVKDWPRHVGEPPWVLHPKGRPKSSRNVPVDSTSSMGEAKKEKEEKETLLLQENREPGAQSNHPGFYVDWNSIPGLYNRKSYFRMLVIAKEEWDHLSDPTQLKHYWEPTQDPDDFHWTLGLALCWTPFHDCSEPAQKKEYVMSVAVVRKPARHLGLPFAAAVEELRDEAEMTPTLLLVRLHQKSLLYPDIYYDRCGTHFTLMHDTGKGYSVGHPQKFLGALL